MGDWMRSLRLSVCIFASLLVFVSFKICHIASSNSLILGFGVLAIACATMVHNDWRDRFHDIRKGKTLAFSKPEKYILFDVMMWIIAFSITAAVSFQSPRQSLLLWAAIASGLAYSETRKIPMVPIFMVSFTSASATLFPNFGGHNSHKLWLFFFAILVVIFGREIIKDLEDVSVDKGYKWTLPQIIGNHWCEIIAGISLAVSFILMILLCSYVIIWLPFPMLSAFLLVFEHKHKLSKKFADVGMALAIATIFFAA